MVDSYPTVPQHEIESQLQLLVDTGQFEQAVDLVNGLPDEHRSKILSRLNIDLQQSLLTGPLPESSAEILHSMPDAQALELLDDIPAETAANILIELPQSEQADLIGELPASVATEILSEMRDPAAAARIRELAGFSDDEAGGIMSGEFLAFFAGQTVEQVIDSLRRNAEVYSDYQVQYGYVTDADGKLLGVLRMRDLLLAEASLQIGELMIPDPLSVSDRTPLTDLHDIFLEHSFLGVPVVTDTGKLTGVVRQVDVEEALGDRNADEFLKTQGIIREELRTMPLLVRSRRRLAWLSINILLNIIAASVIALYQNTISQVIALAVFLPIISDMSGCSGNQAVAVSLRELSLGLVDPRELWRVIGKEASVGLINGLALGLLIALVAVLWQGSPWLGVVVGTALFANTLIAVTLGGCLPLVMRRLGRDPALASGPILTTVTDMCGFFLVLSMATLALHKLTG